MVNNFNAGADGGDVKPDAGDNAATKLSTDSTALLQQGSNEGLFKSYGSGGEGNVTELDLGQDDIYSSVKDGAASVNVAEADNLTQLSPEEQARERVRQRMEEAHAKYGRGRDGEGNHDQADEGGEGDNENRRLTPEERRARTEARREQARIEQAIKRNSPHGTGDVINAGKKVGEVITGDGTEQEKTEGVLGVAVDIFKGTTQGKQIRRRFPGAGQIFKHKN